MYSGYYFFFPEVYVVASCGNKRKEKMDLLEVDGYIY